MSNLPYTKPYTAFEFTRDVYSGQYLDGPRYEPCDTCDSYVVDVPRFQTEHFHCVKCASICRDCKDLANEVELLAEYWDDNDISVTLIERGARVLYGFWANVWWKLDNNFRRDHRVKNAAKIRELNRKSGRIRPQKTEKPREQKLAEWEAERFAALPCDCWNAHEHEHFSLEKMVVYNPCPKHSTVCGVCEKEHPIGEILSA